MTNPVGARLGVGYTGHSRLHVRALQAWIIVSSLYYIDHLFSPSFYTGYDEGITHKVTKYVICFVFSIFFILRDNGGLTALLSISLFMSAFVQVFHLGSLSISAVSVITLASMLGFVHVASICQFDMRPLEKVVILSGVAVALFSIAEVSVLSQLFESYWRSTGGVRSVSTLLNPNNMGLYVGACIVLLLFSGYSLVARCLIGAVLLFPFVASGSRTAWLSLIAAVFLAAALSRRARISLLGSSWKAALYGLMFIGLVYGGIEIYGFVAKSSTIDAVNRGTDLYTASIRVQNFVRFFEHSDASVLIPDVFGVREGYVQDNAFLVFVNSLGLLMAAGIFGFGVFFLGIRVSSDPSLMAWNVLFVYFMISGLSGSFLNSFPNNQLFFISLGATFSVARMRGRGL